MVKLKFWISTVEKLCSDCNKKFLLKFPPGPAEETIAKIYLDEILNVAVRREIRWLS